MTATHTNLFLSNRSQAVRLPKAVSFPAGIKEVEIVAIGNTRLITPAGESWDEWFDGPTVSADFMDGRGQPEEQKREAF